MSATKAQASAAAVVLVQAVRHAQRMLTMAQVDNRPSSIAIQQRELDTATGRLCEYIAALEQEVGK